MSSSRKRVVGLFFGGRSGEHEVSIRSANAVFTALDRQRWEPVLVGIARTGHWYLHREDAFRRLDQSAAGAADDEVQLVRDGSRTGLSRKSGRDGSFIPLDVVFPVLHGTFGEDGTMQGLLELLDLPYVGAGVLGSAVGMDKDVQKRLLAHAGLPIVDYRVLSEPPWRADPGEARRRLAALGLPLFVKPANLGSSVGITKVSAAGALDDAIAVAFRYDRKIVVEKGIDAREIECSVLGNDEARASLPGEIVAGSEFYSYAAKYDDASAAKLLMPAPLSEEMTQKVRSLAVRVFEVLECSGMARVDFFVERDTDRLYVNELNTIPGFTSISMYPKLWEISGLRFADLVSRLLDLALERHEARRKLRVEL